MKGDGGGDGDGAAFRRRGPGGEALPSGGSSGDFEVRAGEMDGEERRIGLKDAPMADYTISYSDHTINSSILIC